MFKKITALLMVIIFSLFIIGCGDTKVIDNVEYDTYGAFNSSEMKNPDVEYRLIIGNVVWSILLFHTIVAPVYFLGFSLYEPISKKNNGLPKGVVMK